MTTSVANVWFPFAPLDRHSPKNGRRSWLQDMFILPSKNSPLLFCSSSPLAVVVSPRIVLVRPYLAHIFFGACVGLFCSLLFSRLADPSSRLPHLFNHVTPPSLFIASHDHHTLIPNATSLVISPRPLPRDGCLHTPDLLLFLRRLHSVLSTRLISAHLLRSTLLSRFLTSDILTFFYFPSPCV